MNTEDITLPDLSDRRRDEIESALFAQIASERRDALADAERARARAARRGRVWMGAAAAAAFVAVAAVIAPQLTAVTGGGGSSISAEQPATIEGARDQSLSLPDQVAGAAEGAIVDGVDAGLDAGDREIIATASATLAVEDARAAAATITQLAADAGGYVESLSIGGSTAVADDTGGVIAPDRSAPIAPSAGAWITVRVPADQLTATIADLSALGEVTASQVDRRDVTTEAVDLRARVTALEASVARLTALMGEATSTADLIAAESALAARQSELDSLRQQLTYLDSQVGMSTLTVTLTEPAPTATADPAGFGDGLAAGWSGLVASLNGLVIAVGFLLPWVAVIALVVLVVWGVRRLVRRRKAPARGSDPGA